MFSDAISKFRLDSEIEKWLIMALKNSHEEEKEKVIITWKPAFGVLFNAPKERVSAYK